MKHIDEIYKDWCGEHHTSNSGYPVHDSAEACDFAEYYHKVMTEANECQQTDATAILPHVSNPLSCDGCKYHNTLNDELCGTCGDLYKNKTT